MTLVIQEIPPKKLLWDVEVSESTAVRTFYESRCAQNCVGVPNYLHCANKNSTHAPVPVTAAHVLAIFNLFPQRGGQLYVQLFYLFIYFLDC